MFVLETTDYYTQDYTLVFFLLCRSLLQERFWADLIHLDDFLRKPDSIFFFCKI